MFDIAELILYPYVIFIMCQEEKGASGGGGPCVYRHWHVRHDEPVWLGSRLLVTPPSLPPSLKLMSLSFCLTPSQSSLSGFTLFLATLPSPGPLENVIRGQDSRW